MVDGLMRGCILAGLAILTVSAAEAAPKQEPQGKLNMDAFLAACVADPVVTDEPGLEAGSKVTPQIYCECIVGKLGENKLSQTDVDMLTKMHKDDISDADAAAYPTLDDLMNTNEGFEDACRTALGLPAVDDEEPSEEDTVPDEGAPDEKNSPPE
jgi:hypothetical protein